MKLLRDAMDWLSVPPWIAAPALAFVLGAVFTGIACRIAPSLGLVDRPDGGRKRHKRPTPVMGGAAFFLAMLTVLLGAAFLGQAWITDPQLMRYMASLLGSALLFCLLGVVDDRFALRPRTKLLGQIFASLPFALSIPTIHTVQLLGWQVPLGPAFAPAIVLWLVTCSNVINLIDGLDGLAGSVGVISLLTVAALFGHQGQPAAATIALVAAGAIGGFLIYNWPPARIFMGDGGSLTLGFLIGAMSIQASSKTATGLTLAVPLVLISVPIFDTLMAIVRRKLNGKGIGEGDRCHIHHRLQDRGLTRKQALIAIGGLSLIMSVAALLSALLESEWAGIVICVGVLTLLIVGQIFGDQETQLFLRHVQALGHLLLDTSGVLKTRFLLARIDKVDYRERLEIWKKVSQRVQQMGGTRLEFLCTSSQSHEVQSGLLWIAASETPRGNGHEWRFEYSVPREQGFRATLVARGVSPSQSNVQRLDDLFRLFSKVCEEMPLFDEADEFPETLPLPASPASESPAADERRRAA
jgi:UDP-GlcNAc:undecaprenyl-phosphate GlcNAc-1-phosphate transferase